MEKINIDLFYELNSAIEARLRHIASIKHYRLFSFRNQIEIDGENIGLITEDYWGGETQTDTFYIKSSEINEPDGYFIAQHAEEQRKKAIREEEEKNRRLKKQEDEEKKEYERLQIKFGKSK